jgi:hypothetical protein
VLHFQIENYLLRNHETRKYLQEQAYRLQQGIVTSTTQQVRAPSSCLSQRPAEHSSRRNWLRKITADGKRGKCTLGIKKKRIKMES